MSRRLQVLIPKELDMQLRKAAQRSRISKSEWVRRALRQSVDPVARLASLNAPTADIEQMLSEIWCGRS
jgi:metal-responsive CopG/Arc/MetJ family transcriptional regulator